MFQPFVCVSNYRESITPKSYNKNNYEGGSLLTNKIAYLDNFPTLYTCLVERVSLVSFAYCLSPFLVHYQPVYRSDIDLEQLRCMMRLHVKFARVAQS
jgi:hypothetical protein